MRYNQLRGKNGTKSTKQFISQDRLFSKNMVGGQACLPPDERQASKPIRQTAAPGSLYLLDRP
jgi:hypothetical protein